MNVGTKDSLVFDFGTTVDYDQADKILTDAGMDMEEKGYIYDRSEDSNQTLHRILSPRSNILLRIEAELDNDYTGKEIEFSAYKNKPGKDTDPSSELEYLEGVLEDAREYFLD